MLLAAATRNATPENETDLPMFVQRVRAVFDEEMEPHFAEEEKHALPRLRELGRDDLADRVYAEHKRMRGLIEEMTFSPSADLIRDFSNLLQAHVQFEEEVVWEVLEEDMDRAAALRA